MSSAWALSREPEKFDFSIYEAQDHIGGNGTTVDIPQRDGSSIPITPAVMGFIDDHYVMTHLMEEVGYEYDKSEFSFSIQYDDDVYAHDYDTPFKARMKPELERFKKLLTFIKQFERLGFFNPFYLTSTQFILNIFNFSYDFRYKILFPMVSNVFVNSKPFSLPIAHLRFTFDFMDIEQSVQINVFRNGCRAFYGALTKSFQDRIFLKNKVKKVVRRKDSVSVINASGIEEVFDDVIIACNANHAYELLNAPSFLERWILSSSDYVSDAGNGIVHYDDSILSPHLSRRGLDTTITLTWAQGLEIMRLSSSSTECCHMLENPISLAW